MYRGEDERGNNWLHPRFDGQQMTRGGGPPARYQQKRRRTAADRLTGHIRGGVRGCFGSSNDDSDGDSNGGDDNDARGVGVFSCDATTSSGSRSISPRNSGRKRSRGTAALGLSTTRLRYGSRSGLGSISRRRRLQGELRGRFGGDRGHDDDDGYNDGNGNIEDNGKDGDDVGGGRRGSGNYNGNV